MSSGAPPVGSVVALLDPDFVFMRPLTRKIDEGMAIISGAVGLLMCLRFGIVYLGSLRTSALLRLRGVRILRGLYGLALVFCFLDAW